MTNNIDPVEIEKIEIENNQEGVAAEPKKVKQPKNPIIQHDILRYRKNKLASSLALLGLALGCVYFLVLYAQVRNDNFYYKWSIAFDVIYNLFFMLFIFLISEQVKNYNRKLFPLQIILGALQVARIFWLPLSGITTTWVNEVGEEVTKISSLSFITMTVCLAASGACILASAVIGFIRSKAVENFNKQLESGEVDLNAELQKEENAGGEVNA